MRLKSNLLQVGAQACTSGRHAPVVCKASEALNAEESSSAAPSTSRRIQLLTIGSCVCGASWAHAARAEGEFRRMSFDGHWKFHIMVSVRKSFTASHKAKYCSVEICPLVPQAVRRTNAWSALAAELRPAICVEALGSGGH